MFSFETVNPGAIQGADGHAHAPHVSVTVFARGMLVHAFTRMYFGGDALDADSALAAVDPARRHTLVAERVVAPDGRARYRWNIHLQGERETVFFDA
jgi:protocatechuate 3,4-dioxygenase alpha subunit